MNEEGSYTYGTFIQTLTRHAEVLRLLSLMTTFRAWRCFSFLLFEDFTLGVVVTIAGLEGQEITL